MTEFSYLDNQVCFAMYSATNAMIRQYRPLLQEYDLTYPQFIRIAVKPRGLARGYKAAIR